MVQCMRKPACSNPKFLKKDGVPRLGRWFCSEACQDADEGIKQMIKEREERESAVIDEKDEESDDFEIDL
jgi:hypothetical protein